MARTYEQWFQEVDRLVQRLIGLGADDLPDWNYRDAYDDGVTPSRAAARAIRAARDF
jgi:hypothetical protein